MNVWVVKASLRETDEGEGWHWENHLGQNHAAYEWGGAEWVRSAYSKKLLREEVCAGDIILCYQTDGRMILGLTRSLSGGLEDPPNSGDYNSFRIAPSNEAFVLDPPLTIAELYDSDCRPKCFGPGTQGTLFPIEPQEFAAIVQVIADTSERQGERLMEWLRKFGYRSP